MQELSNKAGDLAITLIHSTTTNGLIIHSSSCVTCLSYVGELWTFQTRDGWTGNLPDAHLLPLGGEHVLQDEPQPELTQGSEAELEKKELCL